MMLGHRLRNGGSWCTWPLMLVLGAACSTSGEDSGAAADDAAAAEAPDSTPDVGRHVVPEAGPFPVDAAALDEDIGPRDGPGRADAAVLGDDAGPLDGPGRADAAPAGARLESGSFVVTQTWSQETDYARRVLVDVPGGDGPHPAVVLLHGNGGRADGMLAGSAYLDDVIRIVPDGYARSWNILAEDSKAPDVEFVAEVIDFIRSHRNVAADSIAVLGVSNGSALVNRLLIELPTDTFRHAITIVSPLNDAQYDGISFRWDPTGGNAYDTPITPAGGRRVLCVSGTEDGLIPYEGGPGVAGYRFLSAQRSTYVWARHLGYEGMQRLDADGARDPGSADLVHYRYLDGDVALIKVLGGGHDVGRNPDVRVAVRRFLGL